jgi:hypothetical protein
MDLVNRIHSFHKTKRGYLAFALVELAIAYIFASIAIDTGNLWVYLAAIIFTVGAILNFLNLFTAPDRTEGKKAKDGGKKD